MNDDSSNCSGTYTGDVVWLGMHDRRGGDDDSERQMIKVMMIRITLGHCHMILIFCFSHEFTLQISEKFIHPEYDNPARANDVALLKLESAATMGKTVSPACLPDQVLFCCHLIVIRCSIVVTCLPA